MDRHTVDYRTPSSTAACKRRHTITGLKILISAIYMYCDSVSSHASAVLRIYWICEPNTWFRISHMFCICHKSNTVQAHEMPTPRLWRSSTQQSGSTERQELMLCQGGVNWMYESWSCACEKCLYREKNSVLTCGGGRKWQSAKPRKGKLAKHHLVRPPGWIGTAAWSFPSKH